MAQTKCAQSVVSGRNDFYSAIVIELFDLPEFIQAKADAPPTGFEDLDIAGRGRTTFGSSEVAFLGSHRGYTCSTPVT